jgi:hypothetical protein
MGAKPFYIVQGMNILQAMPIFYYFIVRWV